MGIKKQLIFAVMVSWWLLGVSMAKAGDASYPSKPITLIIPYEAGSGTDLEARGMIPFLAKYLKGKVAIEDVPGAGGKIALTRAWKATPDGYTLIYHIIPSSITKQYIFNGEFSVKDYTHIYAISKTNQVLVVNADTWKTWDEFLKAGRSQTLSGGCSAIAGATHMMGLLLAEKFGLKVNWVPYEGGSEALAATAGKHLDLAITFSPTALPLVDAGKLRPLLVFADAKDTTFPQVATSRQLGYDIPLMPTIRGVVGPPRMAPERAKALEEAMAKVVKDQEFLDWGKKRRIDIEPIPPVQYRQYVLQQYEIVEKFKNLFEKAKQ